MGQINNVRVRTAKTNYGFGLFSAVGCNRAAAIKRVFCRHLAASITVAALGLALLSPAKLSAQTQDSASAADAAFNSGPATGPTPITEVPKGERIPVASAQFDQSGYLVTEKSGEVVDVPFADHNLDVMRFGRSTTGEAYLVNEGEAPVLYVPNHYFLVSNVAASVRWQPLPDTYVEVAPIYVSLAPTWDDFIHLDFYADMCWYGGVWGHRPGYLEAMPRRAIIVGGRSFRYEGYREYATEHHGLRLTRDSIRDRGRNAGGELDGHTKSVDRLDKNMDRLDKNVGAKEEKGKGGFLGNLFDHKNIGKVFGGTGKLPITTKGGTADKKGSSGKSTTKPDTGKSK